jgi:hypothetical protein
MESRRPGLEENYDRVLIAVGRNPNCDDLGLENTRVSAPTKASSWSTTAANRRPQPLLHRRCAGGVMLAHKASREARIAVEVICGVYSGPDKFVIPPLSSPIPNSPGAASPRPRPAPRTSPVEVAKFPWGASGRALTFDRPEGITKLIIDPDTERMLGVGIVGQGAGELISEGRSRRRDGGHRQGPRPLGSPPSHALGDHHGVRRGLLRPLPPTPSSQENAPRDGTHAPPSQAATPTPLTASATATDTASAIPQNPLEYPVEVRQRLETDLVGNLAHPEVLDSGTAPCARSTRTRDT